MTEDKTELKQVSGSQRGQKIKILCIYLLSSAVFGCLAVCISEKSPAYDLVSHIFGLICLFLTVGWCHYDALERGYRTSKAMRVSLVLFQFISFPVYLFKSRGLGGFKTLIRSVLFVGVMVMTIIFTGMLCYGIGHIFGVSFPIDKDEEEEMTLATARADVADQCFEDMPFGCFVTRSEAVSKEKSDAIGKRLGAPLEKLSNIYLKVQGTSIQINILEAKTDSGAKLLHQTISAMKSHPSFCLIQNKRVIEFCNAELSTAIKTAWELGFTPKPKTVQYDITARIATIDKADYMSFNKLFNLFLQTNTQNPSKESLTQIRNLSRNFTFGTSVVLRKQASTTTSYEFIPKPVETTDQPHDRISYSFQQIPDVLGVPCVTLNAKVTCNSTGITPTTRKSDEFLLLPTSYWPVNDPQIQALSKKITSGKRTPTEKIQAILEWLTPGRNIRSEGPAGSRWGVQSVLKQKYGHCWDSSDIFVTLARAAGVPARQVGGWLYGTSGHIWAEVLIEGKEWQQVDPTGGGKLECGIYHIPYFVTETGEMPILYLTLPRIKISEEML